MARKVTLTYDNVSDELWIDSIDRAANLAHFLLARTGTIFGSWHGRLTADAQARLLGRKLGKGLIVIDGENETIAHFRKVCFGTDFDCTERLAWRDL
jgi:hypothetical protein